VGSVRLVTYKKQLDKMLKKINSDRSKYLIVCTGHQGEPGSILDRMSRGALPFKLAKDDLVIFSSKTIPSPINEVNRGDLQKRLAKYHVRILDNIHVSGHGGREDLRELINITKPLHVIPSHGDLKKLLAGASLAEEMGYKKDETVHIMQNGKALEIK
jgi:ribonuclease J